MKVKKIIKKYFAAILSKDRSQQAELYRKLLSKSLKGKHTQAIR